MNKRKIIFKITKNYFHLKKKFKFILKIKKSDGALF